MARISRDIKAKYLKLGENSAVCFFCGDHATMNDFTPNQKAAQKDLDEFPGEWVVTRTCDPCWRRLYFANISSGGANYNVPKGCMTIEQKKQHISGIVVKGFTRGRDNIINISAELLTPVDTLFNEDAKMYHYGTHAYSYYEIEVLQGCLALMVLKRSPEAMDRALGFAMAHLDEANRPKYMYLLGM